MPEPDALLAELEARLRPLEIDAARAWWDAANYVSPETESRRVAADLAMRDALGDADAFSAIREARSHDDLDPLTARQLDLLFEAFAPHQVPPALRTRIVELEAEVEGTFNAFRGHLDGRPVDDNEILEILRGSDDGDLRRRAWEASKQVGAEVADRVRELARVRNEAARTLGFPNHFALVLATSELDEQRLVTTLDEVDRATREPFARWKAELDGRLAQRFDCVPGDLRPWHYDDPFFQDPPVDAAVNLDPVFAGADIEALTLRTYDRLGLDIRAALSRSDLFPRDAKSQHAFCIDIDHAGDVRVLCNVTPSERWMGTMLHEFGHAVYDLEVDRALPWFLRTMHALTTEGIAMLFGRFTTDAEWLGAVAGMERSGIDGLRDRLRAAQRAALLVFARWVLVMTNFERGLYAEPDADHDTRWWELVRRYQLVTPPPGRHAPDWAAKIHLAAAPVYYQNYLYGELVASQLDATLRRVAGGLVDRPEAGAYLSQRFFRPGASVRWDALGLDATGEPLSVRAFAEQLA
ncbi:MAG: M2 family metallopeptidase [Actinobacteria bacterium]|nr:M2 family metallopeptidase [Actinomycetota bacterium]